ncbi:MAG: hypothetical protein DIZ80_15790 [endosymbiont of Galathealinum brachiosum]|uniref:PseI/NeuA/B-like domain-containing protein n=1 Tax=endosymbiont of Galathealinum brachiosum TaxID=2200906 RepID=A0A370D9G9_9GAMM|nr:MAG: hypothetical protein DIZ80_15790 [endosymbiont of Galathealinum brachiosum]
MSFYIYAETAFHHEGDKEYLLKLIDEAKNAGLQGIKFQVLMDLNQLMSTRHSSYQDAKKWVFSIDDWKEIFEHAKSIGLDIILMPIDVGAFELISSFDVRYVEIHSVSFKDKKLLSKLDEFSVPLILGVGGRTLDEIAFLVNKHKSRDVTLMVGFQSFPSDLNDIKLGRIKELVSMYPNCTIGYADHSSYDSEMSVTSNEYAYALGARVFEKHITINEGKERIDFQSAVGIDKLKSIVNKLTYLDEILDLNDDHLFVMNEKEINYRNRQKVPVAARDLLVGCILSENDINMKTIDNESAIDDPQLLIGKTLKYNVEYDSAFLQKNIL